MNKLYRYIIAYVLRLSIKIDLRYDNMSEIKRINKRIFCLFFLIIFITINAQGIIRKPTENDYNFDRDYHPTRPDITVHNDGKINVVWESGLKYRYIIFSIIDKKGEKENIQVLAHGGRPRIVTDSNNTDHIIYSKNKVPYDHPHPHYGLFYTNIDKNGNIILKNKELNNSFDSIWKATNANFENVLIDSKNKIHLIYSSNGGTTYFVIDNNGNTLYEFNLTKHMKHYYRSNEWNKKWITYVDVDNSFHIIWDNDRGPFDYDLSISELYYLKLNSQGEVIINKTLMKSKKTFIKAQSIMSDSKGNVYFCWSNYTDTHYLYNPNYTYFSKILPNGTYLDIKRIKNMRIVDGKIDKNDNIHIIGIEGRGGTGNNVGEYLKIATNGDLITSPIKFSNKADHPYGKLAVDNNEDVHIIWKGEISIMEPGFMYHGEPEIYNTIYYCKISNNGDIVIKEKILVTDEEQEEIIDFPFSDNPVVIITCTSCLVILFIISMIILYKFDKKLKKKNTKNNERKKIDK